MIDDIFEKLIQALTGDYEFTLHPDHYRTFTPRTPGKFVFAYTGDIIPQGTGSRGKFYQYQIEFIIDLVIAASGNQANSGGERAGKQLRELTWLVLNILFNFQNIDLDLPAGTIGSRPLPRVETFVPEGTETNLILLGNRIRLPIIAGFEPLTADGLALLQIGVTAPQFGADIDIEQET